MNLRKYLSNSEAEALELDLNTPNAGEKKARYSITKQQWKQVKEIRSSGVLDASKRHEVDPTSVKHLWTKDKNTSFPPDES